MKITKNKKTEKRGKQSRKLHKKSLRFLGVNAAGLKSKLVSFKNALKELNPAVFFH